MLLPEAQNPRGEQVPLAYFCVHILWEGVCVQGVGKIQAGLGLRAGV